MKRFFSHVVRFISICLLLALVGDLNLELFQMDVKTSVLIGNLEEEIYMDKPIGFVRRVNKTKFVVLKDSYMVLSNLLDHVTLDSMKPLLRLA